MRKLNQEGSRGTYGHQLPGWAAPLFTLPSPPKKLLVRCHPNSKSSAYEPWSHCGKVWRCNPFPAGPIPIQKAIHTPPLYKQVED